MDIGPDYLYIDNIFDCFFFWMDGEWLVSFQTLTINLNLIWCMIQISYPINIIIKLSLPGKQQ